MKECPIDPNAIDPRYGITVRERASAYFLMVNGGTREEISAGSGVALDIVDKMLEANHKKDETEVLITRLKSKVHMALDELTAEKMNEETAGHIVQIIKFLTEVKRLEEGKSTANVALSGLALIVENVDRQIMKDISSEIKKNEEDSAFGKSMAL